MLKTGEHLAAGGSVGVVINRAAELGVIRRQCRVHHRGAGHAGEKLAGGRVEVATVRVDGVAVGRCDLQLGRFGQIGKGDVIRHRHHRCVAQIKNQLGVLGGVGLAVGDEQGLQRRAESVCLQVRHNRIDAAAANLHR